jgi:hypothetical protein
LWRAYYVARYVELLAIVALLAAVLTRSRRVSHQLGAGPAYACTVHDAHAAQPGDRGRIQLITTSQEFNLGVICDVSL